MSYRNIVFIKLEKRLLNDHRWFLMREQSQLIWIKFVLLGGHYKNRIPKDDAILMNLMRTKMTLSDFKDCIKEIKKNFPKLKSNKHYYYIDGFEEYTNYIPKREIPSKSPATPKIGVDKDKEEDKDKDKEKRERFSFIPQKEDVTNLINKLSESKAVR